jgi:ATP-binding cassette subfamily C exporter for protease/lipase
MVSSDQLAAPKGAAVPALPELASGEIYRALMKYRGTLVSVALFSGVINLLYLAPAIYMLQIYDRVLTSQSESTLIALTVLVVALFIVTGLLEGIRGSVMARLGDSLEDDLSTRVYSAMFAQQLHASNGHGNQPLWDLQQLRQFFSGSGLYAFLDLPWLPIFLATIFLLHPILGFFVSAGAIVLFATAWISERIARQPLADANEWSMAASGSVTSQLRNTEIIEALGMLPQLLGRWRALQSKARLFQHQAFEQLRITGGLTRVLRMVLQSGTLGLGAWLALKGELTPGAMIAGAILATRALSPLESVIGHWKSFLGSIRGASRLTKLLREHPARVKGMDIPRPVGHLSAENIFVASPSNKHFILKGLTFELRPGQVLGVLGPSAAGKSTLARSIIGVWPVQLGTLRLDGSDIRNLDRVAVGSAIGYLPQDIELFSGTVAENIARFGDLDSAEVIAAANACGIHGLLLELPKGYDTPIGESGVMLSGGQRQLIGLARALYGKPSLVVLDEPSSNLDEFGHRCLAMAIRTMKSWQSAVMVITHDPVVLALADQLMILQDGQIRKMGEPKDVMASLIPIKKVNPHASQH